MQLVFIDETSLNGTFCVSIVIISSAKYTKLKGEYLEILEKYKWDHRMDKNEFKGKVIFSKNNPKTSEGVTVETRIKICNELLEYVVGKKNKRMDVTFFSHECEKDEEDKIYFDVVPRLLKKKLKKMPKKDSKNCVAIFCDNFNRKRKDDLYQKMRQEIATVIRKKGLVFFEEIFFCDSTNYTVGITYADIIGYLVAKKEFGNVRHTKKSKALETLLQNVKKIDKFEYKR